jgi:hypothetical protein
MSSCLYACLCTCFICYEGHAERHHIHTYIHTYMRSSTFIKAYVCVCACRSHMHICMHGYACARLFLARISVWCVFLCACVCVCVRMHFPLVVLSCTHVKCMGRVQGLGSECTLTMHSCLPVHGLDFEHAATAAEMCAKASASCSDASSVNRLSYGTHLETIVLQEIMDMMMQACKNLFELP